MRIIWGKRNARLPHLYVAQGKRWPTNSFYLTFLLQWRDLCQVSVFVLSQRSVACDPVFLKPLGNFIAQITCHSQSEQYNDNARIFDLLWWLITSRCSLMLNFYLIMIILYSCFYCITDRIVSSGFCLYHSRWFMATMSKQWCFKRAYRIPVSGNKHMILDHIYLKCMWPGFMSSEVKHTLVIGASMVSVHVYLVANVELINKWKQNQACHWECLDLTGFQYKSLSLLQQHLLLWTLHILYPVTKLSLTRDTFQCKLHQH